MSKTYAIGEEIKFKTPEGEIKTGKIFARDWSFSTLLYYTVCCADNKRYNVNAKDFTSGYSF